MLHKQATMIGRLTALAMLLAAPASLVVPPSRLLVAVAKLPACVPRLIALVARLGATRHPSPGVIAARSLATGSKPPCVLRMSCHRSPWRALRFLPSQHLAGKYQLEEQQSVTRNPQMEGKGFSV